MKKIYLRNLAVGLWMTLLALPLAAQSFTSALPIPDTIGGPTYDLMMSDKEHAFWSGQDSFMTMAYGNNTFLGPTLMWYTGTPIQAHVRNFLGMGDTTTNHWHGAHVPGWADGGPHEPIAPFQTWSPNFTIMDAPCTMWYHPHLHHHTLEQVQMGLAGLIIIRDPGDPFWGVLPHTYGVDEFPLIVQDRDLQGDTINTSCTMGDTFLVNGRLKPYLEVPAQVVRFHILNGSSERVWMLGLKDGAGNTLPFELMATDAGYTAEPYTLDSVMMGSAERTEWLIDFGGMQGDTFYLVNIAGSIPATIPGGPDTNAVPGCYTAQHPINPQHPGQSIMGPWDSTTTQLMRIIVGAPTSNPITSIPAAFAPLNIPNAANAAVNRRKDLVFDGSNDGPPFLIDSTDFEMSYLNDTVILGDIEVWRIYNSSTVAHPFHIHDVHFFITEINGSTNIPDYLKGPKDVMLVPYPDTMTFVTQFLDFSVNTYGTDSAYMYHCHILSHEDGGMMHQFNVMDTIGVVGREDVYKGPAWMAFPNPTEGRIFLRGDCHKPSVVRLFSLEGRLVTEAAIPAVKGTYELPFENLPKGLFFLEWERPEGMAARKILIK